MLPRAAALLALCLAALPAAASPPARGSDGPEPVRRVLVVRRDVAPEVRLPGGARLWTWPDGGAVVTDTSLAVTTGDSLLVLPCSPALRGTSRGRRLLFQPGSYPVDGTLLLTDSGFTVLVARGRLVISPDTLVVDAGRTPPPQAAQLLLLAGIALLTFALVLRSRSRLRAGGS